MKTFKKDGFGMLLAEAIVGAICLVLAACPPPGQPDPSPAPSPTSGPATYPFVKKDVNPNEYYGPSKAVGNTLFVADNNYGVVGFDISDPDAPRKISTYTHPGMSLDGIPRSFAVTGHYLYYSSVADGIVILDIADATDPEYVASIPGSQNGSYGRIEIAGDLAYFANDARGLLIYDIADPEAPVFAGRCPIPSAEEAWDIALAGDRVLLLTSARNYGQTWTVRTIDASDEANPVIEATYTESGAHKNRLFLSGDVLYAHSWNSSTIVALDASDLGSVHRTDSIDTPYGVFGMAAAGNTLYAGDPGSLCVFDTSDPSDIVYVRDYVNGGAYPLVTSDSRLITTGSSVNGLLLYDIADPLRPALTGQYNVYDASHEIALDGSYAYIANEDAGVVVCDVSSPANAFVAARLELPGSSAWDIALQGGYAYVAGYNSFRIVDIRTPTAPSIVSTIGGLYTTKIQVNGNYAYLGTGSGLAIFDVSDKASPASAGVFDPGFDYGYGMKISGGRLYATGRNGLKILDISDPDSPAVLHTLSGPTEAMSPALYMDRYLYLAYPNEQLYRVYDVAVPSAPVLVHESEQIHNFPSLSVRGDRLYTVGLHADQSDIMEWDIVDPARPRATARMACPPNTKNLSRCVATDDYVFALSAMYGLHVFRKE